MAYTTIVTGTTITSSWANQDVRDQVVVPFASTATRDAAITSPVTGQVSTLTTNLATEGVYAYNSAGEWRAPWNMPWGQVGYASTTSNSSGTTSTTDYSGLSVTWTAVANRLYLISGHGNVTSTVNNDTVALVITDTTPSDKGSFITGVVVATNGQTSTPSYYETNVTGSQTRKIRVRRVTGTGTVTGQAASGAPAYIMVVDMGPTGAPA